MPDLTVDFADGIDLPIDIVTQATAVTGRRNSGKTYSSMKLTEGMLDAGAQVVVVDPVGAWFGLRIAADGVSPGIPIPVLGGLHGDGPLERTSGAAVARAVVETDSSVILDVSMLRKSGRTQFVTNFSEELFQLKKTHRTPLCIVLEEVHTFAPQNAGGGQERPLLGAIEDLVRLGRNFGLGVIMITQRPQAVAKAIWSQAEVAIVHQLTGPHERGTISEWVTNHDAPVKEQLADLPSLQPGEAFLWSPQWLQLFDRVRVAPRWTYDASATPRFGDTATVPEPAPLNVPALAALLAAAADESGSAPDSAPSKAVRVRSRATGKARPAKNSNARITDLEHDLARARQEIAELTAAYAARPERVVERPIIEAEDAARLAAIVETQAQIARDVTAIRRRVEGALSDAINAPDAAGATSGTTSPAPSKALPAVDDDEMAPTAHTRADDIDDAGDMEPEMDGLTRYEQDVLHAVVQAPGSSLTRIALLAMKSPRSSAMGKALRVLQDRGLVTKSGDAGTYHPHRQALALVGKEPALEDGDALIDHWIDWLHRRGSGRIQAVLLDVIRRDHPIRLSAADLEARSAELHPPGYSARSSGMGKAIHNLRTLGLVSGTLGEGVCLADLDGMPAPRAAH